MREGRQLLSRGHRLLGHWAQAIIAAGPFSSGILLFYSRKVGLQYNCQNFNDNSADSAPEMQGSRLTCTVLYSI